MYVIRDIGGRNCSMAATRPRHFYNFHLIVNGVSRMPFSIRSHSRLSMQKALYTISASCNFACACTPHPLACSNASRHPFQGLQKKYEHSCMLSAAMHAPTAFGESWTRPHTEKVTSLDVQSTALLPQPSFFLRGTFLLSGDCSMAILVRQPAQPAATSGA